MDRCLSHGSQLPFQAPECSPEGQSVKVLACPVLGAGLQCLSGDCKEAVSACLHQAVPPCVFPVGVMAGQTVVV